jgi:rare lipoprotein A (peptidoglycan hydrolase)
VPTAALASTPHGGSGGSGIGTGGSSGSTTTTPYSATPATPGATAPGVISIGGVLNASGDGITLSVAASGTQGRPLTLSGNASAADAGQVIDLESSKTGQDSWSQVATATIASNGTFSARWTPGANGQLDLRAVLAPQVTSDDATSASGAAGLSSGAGSAAAASDPSTSALTILIFKNAVATLYGPGFWGHRTACGQRLTRATLGVASRTLKCGTEVAVLYRGREITVPVIDRGPFANGASWDLTMATAKALGIRETATVGTLTSVGEPLTAGS